MNANVSCQLMLLGKLPTAVCTLEWLFSRMSSFVVGTLLIGHEFLATIRAWIPAVIEMCPLVSVSNVSSSKCFATNRAKKRSHFAMRMPFPRVLPGKSHAAFFTFIWSDSTMNTLVMEEHSWPTGILLSAVRAGPSNQIEIFNLTSSAKISFFLPIGRIIVAFHIHISLLGFFE